MSEPPEREQRLVDGLKARFGVDILGVDARHRRIKIKVKAERIVELASYVKNELSFDHVASVSGVDYPNDRQFEVVYHTASYSREDMRDLVIAISTRIPRDAPKMPTLTTVWRSAEFNERETYEMFGIVFEGHPKLERLILPEDWSDIPPLRKDFRPPGR